MLVKGGPGVLNMPALLCLLQSMYSNIIDELFNGTSGKRHW